MAIATHRIELAAQAKPHKFFRNLLASTLSTRQFRKITRAFSSQRSPILSFAPEQPNPNPRWLLSLKHSPAGRCPRNASLVDKLPHCRDFQLLYKSSTAFARAHPRACDMSTSNSCLTLLHIRSMCKAGQMSCSNGFVGFGIKLGLLYRRCVKAQLALHFRGSRFSQHRERCMARTIASASKIEGNNEDSSSAGCYSQDLHSAQCRGQGWLPRQCQQLGAILVTMQVMSHYEP
jgi:hypothetical protein